ncbi:hypothetical protein DOY81_008846, partial [Sarcophaga bullata]
MVASSKSSASTNSPSSSSQDNCLPSTSNGSIANCSNNEN